MAHTLDSAGTRYNNFINAIQSCYDIVTKNRRELSPQVAPSVYRQEENADTAPAAEETQEAEEE